MLVMPSINLLIFLQDTICRLPAGWQSSLWSSWHGSPPKWDLLCKKVSGLQPRCSLFWPLGPFKIDLNLTSPGSYRYFIKTHVIVFWKSVWHLFSYLKMANSSLYAIYFNKIAYFKLHLIYVFVSQVHCLIYFFVCYIDVNKIGWDQLKDWCQLQICHCCTFYLLSNISYKPC